MSEDEGSRPEVQADATKAQQEYWLQLYAKHYGQVRGYLTRRVECSQDVDDLVHDIFVDLFRHNYHMDDPRAYLFTMTRHHLCTYRERQGRSLWAERHAACSDPHTVGVAGRDLASGPVEELLHRERLALVRTILARLAPVLAEALRLRFMEELRLEEATARARCTRDGLQRRLRRATRRFTHLWEQTHSCEREGPRQARDTAAHFQSSTCCADFVD